MTYPKNHTEAIQATKSVWKKFFPDEPFEYAFTNDTLNCNSGYFHVIGILYS